MVEIGGVCPEESRSLVRQAAAFLETPSGKDFPLQQVRTSTCSRAVVEKSYVILSEKECQKVSGQKRSAKDPSLRSIELVDAAGKREEVFCFKDASSPFRKPAFAVLLW